MSNPNEIILKNIDKHLKEISKWNKILAISSLEKILSNVMKSDVEKEIYQLSDGQTGVNEIKAKVKVAPKTITRLWKQWPKLGLGELIRIQGGERFKHYFDLSDFDLLLEKHLKEDK